MNIMDALKQTIITIKNWTDENKVQKISGKGLSTNDYTTAEKDKLAKIADGANKTIVDDQLNANSANAIQNQVVHAAISDLQDLVGETAVSTQINNAVAQKTQVQIIIWESDD